jgi:hypothetical protein
VSPERTEELIRDLVRDLAPVQPIPRLRFAVAALLALWAAVGALALLVLGPRPDLVGAVMAWRGPGMIFLGLGLAGVGGVAAALAMAVPGREATARAGLAAAALGLAVAGGLGSFLLVHGDAVGPRAPAAADFHCLAAACLIGLAPALGAVAFAGRAAPLRPRWLVAVAAAGAVALGAVVAEAACPYTDLRHILLAHVLAPAVGAVLLTLPLLAVLRRSSRQ